MKRPGEPAVAPVRLQLDQLRPGAARTAAATAEQTAKPATKTDAVEAQG